MPVDPVAPCDRSALNATHHHQARPRTSRGNADTPARPQGGDDPVPVGAVSDPRSAALYRLQSHPCLQSNKIRTSDYNPACPVFFGLPDLLNRYYEFYVEAPR